MSHPLRLTPLLHRTTIPFRQPKPPRCRLPPPVLQPTLSSPSATHRPFTTTPTPHATPAARQARAQSKRPSMPSMRLAQERQQREALTTGDLPPDIGPLPGTFIMPRGRHLPSWFGDRRGRFKLEKLRFRAFREALLMYLSTRYVTVRPRPRALKPWKLPAVAAELHARVFGAFAAGEMGAVQTRLCPGLLAALRKRIALRAPGTAVRWCVKRRVAGPRLMSFRVALMPQEERDFKEQNGYLQAVVRIHTEQAMVRVRRGEGGEGEVVVDEQGEVVEGMEGVTPEEALRRTPGKETVENWVLQSVVKKSVMGPWMLWGTVEEVTLEKIRKGEREAGRKEKKMMKGVEREEGAGGNVGGVV